MLNINKIREMTARQPWKKLGHMSRLPYNSWIKQREGMKILEVTITEKLSFDNHVNNKNAKARQSI